MIAEAEMGGDVTCILREDDGVVVWQLVVAVIDELAYVVYGSESAVLIENVVMLHALP
jgi:hypothetical protein